MKWLRRLFRRRRVGVLNVEIHVVDEVSPKLAELQRQLAATVSTRKRP